MNTHWLRWLQHRFVFALPLLLLLLFLVPAWAQDASIYGLITSDGTKLRVGPDFAYSSIGQLPLRFKNITAIIHSLCALCLNLLVFPQNCC